MILATLYQIAEMRKLRAYAQMDKQKSVKEMEERLKKEHTLELDSLRSMLRLKGNTQQAESKQVSHHVAKLLFGLIQCCLKKKKMRVNV